jgi:hypothetical protein
MTVSNSSLGHTRRLKSGATSTAEDDIVQAIVCVVAQKCRYLGLILSAQAYSYAGRTRQIVTGVAEKGECSVIKYWIQDTGLKKPMEMERNPQMATERVWAYLAVQVR